MPEVIALDVLHFNIPAGEEDWHSVAHDDVACSSEEEDRVQTITNHFLKAVRPEKTSNTTTTVKRVGPGQGICLC